MDRRRFLHTSALAAGALASTGLALSACTSESSDPDMSRVGGSLSAIGLQLYTIRTVLEDDFRATMEQVAKLGYDEVEFAGYYDRSPDEIGALLNEFGLEAPATHVPLGQIREAPDELIHTAQAIGHDYIVCPYLSEEERGSLDDYRRHAEQFTRFGERCSEAGLQFAYHNHDFEFEPMDGTVPYEVLLEETDPEHVQMELDLFWVHAADHDPLDYIQRDPGRYPLCHVKDRSADGEMVAVGEGALDFAALFREADFEHYFVEHDNPEAPMQSIETSYQALSQLDV